jgi:hypothetical protein
MEITDAKYVNDEHGTVAINATINGKSWSVPIADNRFYNEIMRQVDAGIITIADAE